VLFVRKIIAMVETAKLVPRHLLEKLRGVWLGLGLSERGLGIRSDQGTAYAHLSLLSLKRHTDSVSKLIPHIGAVLAPTIYWGRLGEGQMS